ncbi:MAG TPA: cyclic nucleotide-binding domain-containing protein [Polyangia bacterium]|nr:cyclic nucleotide-binding domain-containing protein [Polyangia bacterium]
MFGRPDPARLRARAEELERKGKRERALAAYRDLAAADPVDPDLWRLLGEKELAHGDGARAAQAFFRVTDLLARAGLLREALTAAGQALAADPHHGAARRLHGILERRLHLLDQGPEPEPPPGPPKVIVQLDGDTEATEVEAVPIPITDGPAEVVVMEAEEPPSASAEEEPEVRVTGSGRVLDPGAPLETMVLTERLLSEQAAQAAEIALDDQARELFEPPRERALSPLSSPLLGAVDNAVLEALVELATTVKRAAGEVVFRQGDPGTALYVILRGEVEVLHEEGAGPPKKLASLHAGAFFGEMALITNEPRNATVLAVEDCEFLVVARQHVQKLIDTDREVLRTILRFFRARLVGTLVQTSPLFRGLSLLERRNLIGRFRLREIAPGALVIREGQPSDALCVALAGRLAVTTRVHGEERLLARLHAGDIYGEMSLLTGGPAVATIRAESKVWALALPRRDFEQVITGRPALRAMLEKLAAERRALNDAIRRGEAAYSEGKVEPV